MKSDVRPPLDERERKLMDLVAKTQKGDPEQAMLRVQEVTGGGILNVVVEHGGDIAHRIADGLYQFNDPNFLGEPLKKTKRILDLLNQPYGFEKEMMEQIRVNSEMRNISFEEALDELKIRLGEFAKAHSQIPNASPPIYLANQGNIAVGEGRFEEAAEHFSDLLKMMQDSDRYNSEARRIGRWWEKR
jgi:hypothetical protein